MLNARNLRVADEVTCSLVALRATRYTHYVYRGSERILTGVSSPSPHVCDSPKGPPIGGVTAAPMR